MPTAGRMRTVQSKSEASVALCSTCGNSVVTAQSNTVTGVSLLREELEPHGNTELSHKHASVGVNARCLARRHELLPVCFLFVSSFLSLLPQIAGHQATHSTASVFLPVGCDPADCYVCFRSSSML